MPIASFQVSLRLRGRRVVVVGGGPEATRLVPTLLAAGADVTVVAPSLTPTLENLAQHRLVALRREYQPGDLNDAWLVIACSGQPDVDAAVAAEADQRRVWCIRQNAPDASATLISSDISSEPEPAIIRAPRRRILVLGGARSGKSATAERILAGHDRVRYVATGPIPGDDDPTWAERVRAHRHRRPHGWQTVETLDIEPLLTATDEAPMLLECLATWLAGVMEQCGVWDERPGAEAALAARVDRLVAAWRSAGGTVVAVSNEVGCGVVPHTPSGRRFRDELGWLNARIAAESDEVWLCVAGIPQRLR